MKNSTQSKISISRFSENLQRMTDATSQLFQSHARNTLQWVGELQDSLSGMGLNPKPGMGLNSKDCCGACPPECDCPPSCLLSITREASAGERVIVPFRVKNGLQTARTYKIGLRPFYDDKGNEMNSQPILDKSSMTLQPSQSALVEMSIDLGQGYQPGHAYSTEIVIREDNGAVNQNICFTLEVNGIRDIPVAVPLDECCYSSHFQDWKSHYYCDRPVSGNSKMPNGSLLKS